MPQDDPSVWPFEHADTRALVESLIHTHATDWPLDLATATDPELASAVWPLCHQTFRFGASALALIDADLAHEVHVLLRCGIEYAVTAHYLEQLGPAGADTWIASQRVQADRTLNLAMASMPLDEILRASVETDAAAVEEQTALDGFLQICKELDALPYYSWWGLESTFVHPRAITQNVFTDIGADHVVLRHEPALAYHEPRDMLRSFALVLLWSALTKERLRADPARLQLILDTFAMIGQQPLPPITNRPAQYPRRRPRRDGWTADKANGDSNSAK
jgi:hypothetical protein